MTNAALSETRNRIKWGRFGLIALATVFFLLIGLSLWLTVAGDPKNQFRISPETTVLTEPLTRDGLVDYVEALRQRNREEVPPDQNAARLLLEAIGPQAFTNEDEARQAYEQLEMESLPSHGEYFTSLDDVIEHMAISSGADTKQRQLVIWQRRDALAARPWEMEEAPELAQWISDNELPLKKFVEASLMPSSRAPVLVVPGLSLFSSRQFYCHELRELARSLVLRATLHLGEGDLTAAWSDLHAVHRLARLISRDVSRLDYVLGTGIAARSRDATAALLSSPAMTPDLLARIRADWKVLPEWGDPATSLDAFERYATLDVIQHTARYGMEYLAAAGMLSAAEQPLASGLHWLLNACVDWDESMEYVNEWYDQWVTAVSTADRVERDRRLNRCIDDFEAMRTEVGREFIPSTFLVSGYCVAMFIVLPETIKVHLNTLDTEMALVETAMAIEQYRFDHGTIPETLNDLVPEYLAEIPRDPHLRTKEFCLSIQGTDAYVLYSVGRDGSDNGGLTEEKDIAFRVRMPVPEWLQLEEIAEPQ